MKKNLTALFFAVLLCFSTLLCIPVAADDANLLSGSEAVCRLTDDARLLSDSEAEALLNKLDEISTRQSMDVVVVTVDSLGGKTAEAFADDLYDGCGYGYGADRSGILLLVSINDRKWAISTCGQAIQTFTSAGQSYITDTFLSDLSDGYYADAFTTFADLCDQFITQDATGKPYDVDNMPKEPFSLLCIPIALLIGFVIALIVTAVMKGQLKSVRFQPAAESYVRPGSLNVTEHQDWFLYRKIDRRLRPKDDSSGGGSSTHTSSSGTTHGGSSGSF